MLGEKNISATAICDHWIGYVYRIEQNIDEALETQIKALKQMEENTAGITKQRFVSDSCFELGCFYHEKGDLDNAVEFHQRSLLLREKQVGDFKPKLQSYAHLAMVLMSVKLERPPTSNDHPVLKCEIVSFLDKAVELCKEQSQRGNARERFPVFTDSDHSWLCTDRFNIIFIFIF